VPRPLNLAADGHAIRFLAQTHHGEKDDLLKLTQVGFAHASPED
jgi:hypothetical protein